MFKIRWLYYDFYQIFKEELIVSSSQTLPRNRNEGILPKSFYKTSITMVPKPDKNTARKENYRPIFLNIHAKIFNHMLSNHIQQNVQELYTMIKWYFFPRSKNDLTSANQSR